MYNQQLEELIQAALADGVLTEQEKQILFKRAKAYGVSLDEFEMVLNARLFKMQKEKATASKTNKLGQIKKCPNCGATIQSFMIQCPECGVMFENVEANASMKELEEKLQHTRHGAWDEVIQSFPIPTSKSNLIEFMSYLKAHSSEDSFFGRACKRRLEECILKAKVICPNDEQVNNIIVTIEKEKKDVNNKKHAKKIVKIIIAAAIVIIPIIVIVKGNLEKRSAIDDQYDSIVSIVNSLPVPDKNNYDSCARIIQTISWCYIDCDDSEGIKDYQRHKSHSAQDIVNGYIKSLQSIEPYYIETKRGDKKMNPKYVDEVYF